MAPQSNYLPPSCKAQFSRVHSHRGTAGKIQHGQQDHGCLQQCVSWGPRLSLGCWADNEKKKKKKSFLSKKQLWCWNNWHTSSAVSLWSQLCRLKRGMWVGTGRWQNCQTRHLWEWNTMSVQTSYTIHMGIVIVPGCAFSKRFMPFSDSLKKDKEGPVLFT